MTRQEFKDALEERIQAMYATIDQYIKDDIVEASAWARRTLTNHEGAGHDIYVSAGGDDMVVCSFAKPEWSGDHCGRPMDHGAEAIVIAVCEYLCGG